MAGKIRKVGVLGAGTMGHGIAEVALWPDSMSGSTMSSRLP